MKALVTGAAGFVGRHLVRTSRRAATTSSGIDRDHGPDLLDPPRSSTPSRPAQPDAVYHLGGWSDVGGSWDEPLAAFRANAEGTLNLLQACLAAGVRRVLSVSSADVYGRVTLRRAAAHRGLAAAAGHARTRPARSRPTTSGCRPTSATGSR